MKALFSDHSRLGQRNNWSSHSFVLLTVGLVDKHFVFVQRNKTRNWILEGTFMLFQWFVSNLTSQYCNHWCAKFVSVWIIQLVIGSPTLKAIEKCVYNYQHNVKHITSMWQISAMSHQRRLSSKRYNLQHRLHLPEDLRDNLRRSQGCHLPTMTESDQRSLKKSKDLTLKKCQIF